MLVMTIKLGTLEASFHYIISQVLCWTLSPIVGSNKCYSLWEFVWIRGVCILYLTVQLGAGQGRNWVGQLVAINS